MDKYLCYENLKDRSLEGWIRDLTVFRRQFINNCAGVALCVATILEQQGYYPSILSFNAHASGISIPIGIWDSRDYLRKYYKFHTVVLCGNVVFDVLHQDFVSSLSKYKRMLNSSNPNGYDLVFPVSTIWNPLTDTLIRSSEYLECQYSKDLEIHWGSISDTKFA